MDRARRTSRGRNDRHRFYLRSDLAKRRKRRVTVGRRLVCVDASRTEHDCEKNIPSHGGRSNGDPCELYLSIRPVFSNRAARVVAVSRKIRPLGRVLDPVYENLATASRYALPDGCESVPRIASRLIGTLANYMVLAQGKPYVSPRLCFATRWKEREKERRAAAAASELCNVSFLNYYVTREIQKSRIDAGLGESARIDVPHEQPRSPRLFAIPIDRSTFLFLPAAPRS